MTQEEIFTRKQEYLYANLPYKMSWWQGFRYDKLSKAIRYIGRAGTKKENETYSDCWIMLDTETSKQCLNPKVIEKGKEILLPVDNYVVAWTISIRAWHQNIVTLYGSKPSEMAYCIKLLLDNLPGAHTLIYAHNLPYDWVFIRDELIRAFGKPEKQLNIKPHYPLSIEFANGLILRDSLALSQRSLEKWASDLNVEHQKAVGCWDYEKIRNQSDIRTLSEDELKYIENDTLAGVECLDKLSEALHKHVYSIPYTATGIPRDDIRKIGRQNHARDLFNRHHPDITLQQFLECAFHGGYCHANRHLIDVLVLAEIYGLIKCYDFSSSYPFNFLSEMYPTAFRPLVGINKVTDILARSKKYAFMFKLTLVKPKLKEYLYPMPYLQYSKATYILNPLLDNGRVLEADMIEIYLTEIDLGIIAEQYEWESDFVTNCYYSVKRYLPRWFTDYVYQLYSDKCTLKGEDTVLYAIAKAKLNSCYGMCVQKPCKPEISEVYESGEYEIQEDLSYEEMFEKYIKNPNSILPYQWGVWCTAYAARNLFELGKCCDLWLYSDTDSIYGIGWNDSKVQAYNENCIKKLKANGYEAVTCKGREYWLGIAEHDPEEDTYTEFKFMGAKRYAGRHQDGSLKITVAGVPKKTGVKCLNNDLNNFKPGLIFDGGTTKKLTHTYIYKDKYIDSRGNEVSNSIDLTPCDYLLDRVDVVPEWTDLITEDIDIQVYDDKLIYGKRGH